MFCYFQILVECTEHNFFNFICAIYRGWNADENLNCVVSPEEITSTQDFRPEKTYLDLSENILSFCLRFVRKFQNISFHLRWQLSQLGEVFSVEKLRANRSKSQFQRDLEMQKKMHASNCEPGATTVQNIYSDEKDSFFREVTSQFAKGL